MITIRLKQIYVKINENIICLLNPQLRALESGNSAQGIRNPANDWNPKSSTWSFVAFLNFLNFQNFVTQLLSFSVKESGPLRIPNNAAP